MMQNQSNKTGETYSGEPCSLNPNVEPGNDFNVYRPASKPAHDATLDGAERVNATCNPEDIPEVSRQHYDLNIMRRKDFDEQETLRREERQAQTDAQPKIIPTDTAWAVHAVRAITSFLRRT